jgi:hypothetical protein
MNWGAVLGWLIITSIRRLLDTSSHKRPGVVHYGDGERSPEWSERVPEHQYKRHNYATGGMMLLLVVGLWYYVARAARDEGAKRDRAVGK